MIWIATGFLLGAFVLGLAAFGAIGIMLIERRQRRRLEREKEGLLDAVWELKAAASARNKAEAANEAKSRFLAMVSHEFRTPLAGILGMADLLAATEVNGEQYSYVEAIRLSAESLASLINEILDFSKIEAGKLELNIVGFDLPALIEGMAELLAPRAQGKGIEIATFIDQNVPRQVMGDPDRLRQVLLNLVGNAIKFTERGGVGIRLEASSPDRVSFSVCDTGSGVPLERRETIFEEFEQADGSFSRKHEGTGLGLAISRTLVKLMGGELRLARTGADGSIFTFEISLARIVCSSEPAQNSPDLAGYSVLLVANSPFGAPYLEKSLIQFGANVVLVQGEGAALDYLQTHVPTLVIIDCALGEQSAQRLVRLARARGARRNLVLFSPFERRAFGEALTKDFDGWLVKPVRSKSLRSRLAGNGDIGAQLGETPPWATIGRPLQGLSILLAEDNDINAILVDRHLQRLGARTLRACDGAEAVAIACGNLGKFDAILMDMRMPGVDGLTAARRIREAEHIAKIEPARIIALTANVSAEDRAAALAAGMNGFLAKPVDCVEMAEAIVSR